MVLSFKKGKFLFRKKIKKPVEKPSIKTDSIVCLRYVQYDEFDTNYVIDSTHKSEAAVNAVAVAAPKNEISRINSRSLESVTSEEFYDEEELTQLQKKTKDVDLEVEFAREENKVEMKKTDKTVRIEDEREVMMIESAVAEISKKENETAEQKVEKPIKSILKKYTTEEIEKKSTLIFMTENHDEDMVVFDDGTNEDGVDTKPLKKFNQENVYNKTANQEEKEEEEKKKKNEDRVEEDEKEYSSNAASIFFDDDEPEPTERVRKIDLKRDEDKEDVASLGSQTSA